MSLRTLIRVAAATLVLVGILCLVPSQGGMVAEDIAGKYVIGGQGMHAA